MVKLIEGQRRFYAAEGDATMGKETEKTNDFPSFESPFLDLVFKQEFRDKAELVDVCQRRKVNLLKLSFKDS